MKLINSISSRNTFPEQVGQNPISTSIIGNCCNMQLMMCMCIRMY
ncbi:hypothetical protein [Pedobacter ureilyticus]|nr:hypothetical protein [Pedobacter helvus]